MKKTLMFAVLMCAASLSLAFAGIPATVDPGGQLVSSAVSAVNKTSETPGPVMQVKDLSPVSIIHSASAPSYSPSRSPGISTAIGEGYGFSPDQRLIPTSIGLSKPQAYMRS